MKIWFWPTLICIKVGPLSLTHESKMLDYFWHWLWHNFDSRQSYQAYDASQRWAKVPLMYALAIFDKTCDHFWFDSRQKLSNFWSNMTFDTFNMCHRRGAKAIFRAVFNFSQCIVGKTYSEFSQHESNLWPPGYWFGCSTIKLIGDSWPRPLACKQNWKFLRDCKDGQLRVRLTSHCWFSCD